MANRPHHIEPALGSARIALVYKAADCSNYSPTGLGITACQTAKALRAAGIWAEAWACTSAADLLSKLRQTDADAIKRQQLAISHVVIYAPWIATEDVATIAGEFRDTLFVITSHSNFGFLAADPHGVKLLRETAELQVTAHNVRVGGNCERFALAAGQILGVDVQLLPNLLPLDVKAPRVRSLWAGDSLRLGLFGAARQLKNGLTAAAAACELAATLRVPMELHVTAEQPDGGTLRAIEELCDGAPNLKLVRTGWLPWAKLLQLVQHMHLVFQPSFTESFNCVAAEAIQMGVPVVGSDAIEWLPRRWQADADDAGDVARVAEYLIKSPTVLDDGRRALAQYMDNALDSWRDFADPSWRKPRVSDMAFPT
jgi:glycosyltransferase involved in cell wall biosynthesis